MDSPRAVPLTELQPSQLYVSSAKLTAIEASWDPASLEPLPVKRYGGCLVLTDGHTRAVAASRAGLTHVPTVLDDDPLDDDAYEACLRWCAEEGVRSVADLGARILSPEAYERLWLDRCRSLHRRLATERERRANRPAAGRE